MLILRNVSNYNRVSALCVWTPNKIKLPHVIDRLSLSFCLSWRMDFCSTCLTPVSPVKWKGLWEMLFCLTVSGTHCCFRETDHPPFCGSTSPAQKSFCTIRRTSEGSTCTHCLSGAPRLDPHSRKPAQVSSHQSTFCKTSYISIYWCL